MTKSSKNFMAGKHWIIVIIIIVAGYQIYNGLKDIAQSNNGSKEWTEEDRTSLIDKCIKETGNNGILFPDIARKFCECSHELLLAKFSKSEYLEVFKKPKEEQIEISTSVFKDCLTTYQNELKSKESDEWTDAEYQLMVEKCMQYSGENAVNHPAITRKYCECSRKKLIENFTKPEMAEFLKKSIDEQNRSAIHLVEDCLIEFEKNLEKAQN
tara:strand:+ start:173 stop:808 length:636 start_codon:yes stop_codon:yes gene_type:complete